jgi:diguanylate cyclase (GGDEF)-like protein
MPKRCYTLLDELMELVCEQHAKDVSAIVNMLETINECKSTVNNNGSMDELYKKIAYELQVHFQVFSFQILLVKLHESQVLYSFGEQNTTLSDVFTYRVDPDVSIIVNIFPQNQISKFQRLSLNSYFTDMVNILYLHYIVENSENSSVDPLTKLTNRTSYQEELKTLIPLALRENMNIGALIINIDRFTAVNDEHGNEFGDQFLKLYANTIKKNIRSSDMAVRFGGGEFLILLVNIENEQTTLNIAKKLQEILKSTSLKTPVGDDFKKTVCIGVSMFPEDSNDIHEVVKNAEVALVEAKDNGRNSIQRFEKAQESPIELF